MNSENPNSKPLYYVLHKHVCANIRIMEAVSKEIVDHLIQFYDIAKSIITELTL